HHDCAGSVAMTSASNQGKTLGQVREASLAGYASQDLTTRRSRENDAKLPKQSKQIK
ncbi:hypothetical protein A2U01_0097904, partial [Trifolium medium]|nr:hypothetical protein [Trifolium medium]